MLQGVPFFQSLLSNNKSYGGLRQRENIIHTAATFMSHSLNSHWTPSLIMSRANNNRSLRWYPLILLLDLYLTNEMCPSLVAPPIGDVL